MTQRETNKRAIRQAFGEAAQSYDAVAAVQTRVVRQLIGLCPAAIQGQVLDAGCGTGSGLRALAARYPEARFLGLDAALGMCRSVATPGILCGDIEALPLRTESLALYWSSLAWQWTTPRLAAAEAFRTLQSGGELRVATLGPQTMFELREVFAGIDAHQHVRSFDQPESCAAALQLAGFTSVRIGTARECGYYSDLASLMRSIRRLGAHVLDRRRQTLMGRQTWARLSAAYERYRTAEGLPVSHDVIYLSARKD